MTFAKLNSTAADRQEALTRALEKKFPGISFQWEHSHKSRKLVLQAFHPELRGAEFEREIEEIAARL